MSSRKWFFCVNWTLLFSRFACNSSCNLQTHFQNELRPLIYQIILFCFWWKKKSLVCFSQLGLCVHLFRVFLAHKKSIISLHSMNWSHLPLDVTSNINNSLHKLLYMQMTAECSKNLLRNWPKVPNSLAVALKVRSILNSAWFAWINKNLHIKSITDNFWSEKQPKKSIEFQKKITSNRLNAGKKVTCACFADIISIHVTLRIQIVVKIVW